jgi:hypothetical protein
MVGFYVTGNVQVLSSSYNERVGGYDSDPIYETRYNSEVSRTFCYYLDNLVSYGDAFNTIKNQIFNAIDNDETTGYFWNVRFIPEDQFFDDTGYYYFTG